jgi:hypothetical protein
MAVNSEAFAFDFSKVPSFFLLKNTIVSLLLGLLVSTSVFSQSEPVKMSKSGICHKPGSTYYQQTKNFTPYKTLDQCLKDGGRLPKK